MLTNEVLSPIVSIMSYFYPQSRRFEFNFMSQQTMECVHSSSNCISNVPHLQNKSSRFKYVNTMIYVNVYVNYPNNSKNGLVLNDHTKSFKSEHYCRHSNVHVIYIMCSCSIRIFMYFILVV